MVTLLYCHLVADVLYVILFKHRPQVLALDTDFFLNHKHEPGCVLGVPEMVV